MALGVPMGPLWGKLQKGESVKTPPENIVQPSQVLGPARRGRHIAFVVDTRPAPGIYSLCKKADLAFLEGMFLTEHSEHAEAKGHMTVRQAARIARKSEAARAVLVHISPRYENSESANSKKRHARNFTRSQSEETWISSRSVFPKKAVLDRVAAFAMRKKKALPGWRAFFYCGLEI